jgi:hypothetical protein
MTQQATNTMIDGDWSHDKIKNMSVHTSCDPPPIPAAPSITRSTSDAPPAGGDDDEPLPYIIDDRGGRAPPAAAPGPSCLNRPTFAFSSTLYLHSSGLGNLLVGNSLLEAAAAASVAVVARFFFAAAAAAGLVCLRVDSGGRYKSPFASKISLM